MVLSRKWQLLLSEPGCPCLRVFLLLQSRSCQTIVIRNPVSLSLPLSLSTSLSLYLSLSLSLSLSLNLNLSFSLSQSLSLCCRCSLPLFSPVSLSLVPVGHVVSRVRLSGHGQILIRRVAPGRLERKGAVTRKSYNMASRILLWILAFSPLCSAFILNGCPNVQRFPDKVLGTPHYSVGIRVLKSSPTCNMHVGGGSTPPQHQKSSLHHSVSSALAQKFRPSTQLKLARSSGVCIVAPLRDLSYLPFVLTDLAVRNGGPKKATMVYILVLINAFIFFLSKFGGVSTSALYLYHYKSAWYQLVTSTFCHASLQVSAKMFYFSPCSTSDNDSQHLSGNLFPLLVFGRLVEDELGGFGLLFAYILCGVSNNLCTSPVQLVMPQRFLLFEQPNILH
jgi:hypothetical protein